MKKILMFLTLLILAISCGTKQDEDVNETKPQGVEVEDLQVIDEKLYKYGEEKPYSGKVITRDEDGKIVMIETSKDGSIEGEVKTYYETGKLKEVYNVKDDKIEGKYNWYGKDGSIEINATYKNNERETETAISTKDKKPYTGTYTETYANGNVSQVIKFNEGKRDGETIYYYDNGKIKERIPYTQGLREGNYFYYNKVGEVIGKGAK